MQFTTQKCPSMANQSARMQNVPYSKAIGSVLWLVVVSRPDAAYAVGTLSQFIQNPGPAHWEVYHSDFVLIRKLKYGEIIKCIISYLGSTKNLWLTFGGNIETMVKGYCNSDWASQQHWHSISGFCSTLVMAPCHGARRNKMLLPYQVRRPNTLHKPMWRRKPCGYEILSVK